MLTEYSFIDILQGKENQRLSFNDFYSIASH